jgi:NitT/TauT family transport system substrate-binding protein
MNQVLFSRTIPTSLFLISMTLGITMGSGYEAIAQDKKTIRIAIGVQDQVINTATGGPIIREEKLLEKYLPKSGKYQNVDFKVEWSSYTSGPPITNKMLAGQLDIGMMGDFPATINMTTFQKKGGGVNTLFISTLGISPSGAGNAIMVPKDSPIRSIADLRGKEVSVPFGSAAHGMLLRALRGVGIDPNKDVKLVSQSPEVGGTNLKTSQIAAHANFVPFGELFPYRGFARKIFDGAQTGVPTMHGVLVRSDFAKENPEVVVAYLKAMLEANRMFREQPEAMSAKIEKWTSVDKEVVYMFLGPSGLQMLDPSIRTVNINALKGSVITLKQLGRLEESIKPDDVTKWIDDSFLKKAIAEMKMTAEGLQAEAVNYKISGNDALTKEPIKDAKKAAQIWVDGEPTIRKYASIANMVKALQGLNGQGKKIGSIFVQDAGQGWKLFASSSYFVRKGKDVSAFLIEKDAKDFASKNGGQVSDFPALQKVASDQAPSKNLSSARF